MNTTSERGSMLIGLLLIGSMILLGFPMTMTSLTDRGFQNRLGPEVQALATAEAGAELALWEFIDNNAAFPRNALCTAAGTPWSCCTDSGAGTCPWQTSTDSWCSGTCLARVVPITASTGSATGTATVIVKNVTGYTPAVRSSGQAQGSPVTTRVALGLQKARRSGFDYATFANRPSSPALQVYDPTSSTGAGTDSYISTTAPYNSVTARSYGDIATNRTSSSSITIGGTVGVVVKGKALIGPGGDPVQGVACGSSCATDLTGGKENLPSTLSLASVSMPTCDMAHTLGSVSLVNGTMVLAPGTWCADTVKMDGATSKLSSTGQVKLYVTNWLTMQNGATIESDGGTSIRPENMQIYLKAGGGQIPISAPNVPSNCSNFRVCLATSAKATGTIYGPDANVNIKDSSVHVYGAVAGSWGLLYGFIHYDEHLKEVQTDYGAGSLGLGYTTIKSWQRQESPE